MARSCGTAATLFVLTLLSGGCASTPEPPAPRPLVLPSISRTGVQPGDQVVIRFYTAAGSLLTEVSGERTIDGNGSLFLPFLGTVEVVGLGSEEVQSLLEDRYGVLYADPVIEVVTNVNVNITGAVARPGQFFVPPSATLVDALARAGGVTSELGQSQGGSDASRVRLVRDGISTAIDMRPLDVRPEILELKVQSGDWLYVPRTFTRSELRENITFLSTILSTLFTLASLIVLISR